MCKVNAAKRIKVILFVQACDKHKRGCPSPFVLSKVIGRAEKRQKRKRGMVFVRSVCSC